MELTPRERDKLLLFTAALLAERRLARGVRLNYPEAIAYQRRHSGRRPRRALRCRDDELRHDLARSHAGPGWRRGDDSGDSGRGDVSRRHQARDRSPSDSMILGEIIAQDGAIELNQQRPTITPLSRIRATGRSRSARIIISRKPTLRWPSIVRQRGAFASISPRELRCDSSRDKNAPWSWSRWPERAWSTVSAAR